MILTTVNTHILQQVIQQLYKLPYNEVNTLIDSLNYDLQHYTWDEAQQEERQPIGFKANNNEDTDEEEDGDDGDDGFCD